LSVSGQSAHLTQTRASEAGQLPSLSGVAKSSMPAVVNIATSQKLPRRRRSSTPAPGPSGESDPLEELFRRFGEQAHPREQRSLGSGFIISEDGYIVTNKHVVGDATAKVTVHLSSKEEYQAKVVGTDDKTDIALIKINAKHSLPT